MVRQHRPQTVSEACEILDPCFSIRHYRSLVFALCCVSYDLALLLHLVKKLLQVSRGYPQRHAARGCRFLPLRHQIGRDHRAFNRAAVGDDRFQALGRFDSGAITSSLCRVAMNRWKFPATSAPPRPIAYCAGSLASMNACACLISSSFFGVAYEPRTPFEPSSVVRRLSANQRSENREDAAFGSSACFGTGTVGCENATKRALPAATA
jgi:hypothetical protein